MLHEDKIELKSNAITATAISSGLMASTYGALELKGRDNASAEANHFVYIEVADGATISVEQAGLVAITGLGLVAAGVGLYRAINKMF